MARLSRLPQDHSSASLVTGSGRRRRNRRATGNPARRRDGWGGYPRPAANV